MKITKSILKQIIKEELQLVNEQGFQMAPGRGDTAGAHSASSAGRKERMLGRDIDLAGGLAADRVDIEGLKLNVQRTRAGLYAIWRDLARASQVTSFGTQRGFAFDPGEMKGVLRDLGDAMDAIDKVKDMLTTPGERPTY